MGDELVSFFTASGDSPATWYHHAIVASLAPPLATIGPGNALRELALMSLAVLGAFVLRERRDRAKKIRYGIWGPKWKRDRWADLLAPVTAAACYTLTWIVL